MWQHRAMLIAAVGLASGLLTGAGTAGPSAAAAVWGTAEQVPGSNTQNQGGRADIASVSCASAGNCGAGGSYASGLGGNGKPNSQALVVTETGGTWHSAREVPGTASLDQGSSGAAAASVSCGAVGDCGLGGYYIDASGRKQAFVASQASGTWGAAQEVPGTAALNAGRAAGTDSVSCAAAGNCSAGGHYTTSPASQQAFVANETGGP
jgi:hypothetical protein